MYTLTERRFAAAKPILDKYRDSMRSTHQLDCGAFEKELRDCWDTGYREIKDIMIQLLDYDDYRLAAAWYMQHSNATGVVSEFQSSLAKLYGVSTEFSPEEMQRKFWAAAFGTQ